MKTSENIEINRLSRKKWRLQATVGYDKEIEHWNLNLKSFDIKILCSLFLKKDSYAFLEIETKITVAHHNSHGKLKKMCNNK